MRKLIAYVLPATVLLAALSGCTSAFSDTEKSAKFDVIIDSEDLKLGDKDLPIGETRTFTGKDGKKTTITRQKDSLTIVKNGKTTIIKNGKDLTIEKDGKLTKIDIDDDRNSEGDQIKIIKLSGDDQSKYVKIIKKLKGTRGDDMVIIKETETVVEPNKTDKK